MLITMASIAYSSSIAVFLSRLAAQLEPTAAQAQNKFKSALAHLPIVPRTHTYVAQRGKKKCHDSVFV